MPATGTVHVTCNRKTCESIGQRRANVWDDEPEGVYIPNGLPATITCKSDSAEVFVAVARCDQVLAPFVICTADIDPVQYGSDDTKTHRKITHIPGTRYHDRVGHLLVSELFTVGAGSWSGFPSHKHDTDRLPPETRHDEVYNFRFNPRPAGRACR